MPPSASPSYPVLTKVAVGIFVDVQEVGRAQVLVALGVVRVDARGVDLDRDGLRLGPGLGIEREAAGHGLEGADHPGDADVRNLELNEAVPRIDRVVGGLAGRACECEGGGHESGPESALEHGRGLLLKN